MSDDERRRVGKFLGVPYDWRRPTKARFKSRWWNPEDPRFVTPRAFGWGYDFNLYRLFHRRESSLSSSYLKERCIWRSEFETLDDARSAIAAYVEDYHHRPHSGLDYRTPKEVAAVWEDGFRSLNK